MTSDRVLASIGIALAAFFIWQATEIQVSFISDPVGAKVFPIIIASALAIACLFMLIRPDAPATWPKAGRLLEIAVAVGVLFAYSIALPEVGFVVSTVIASAYLAWRLGTPFMWAVVAGFVISLTLYVIFHLVLGLSLARGPLGF